MTTRTTKPKTPTEDEAARAQPVEEPTADQLAAAATLEDEAAKRPVIVKLARIMASLPTLLPEGKNQHFNYKFIKDTQISGAIRPRMAAERLMVIPNVLAEEWVELVTSKGGKSHLTKLTVEFTVIDGDSGDQISGVGIGYGDDAGDKGANKAITAAMKYWLIKLFQIGGEDDLESDERADLRAASREAGGDLSAATPVRVEGAQVENVQRGGRQDGISKAQMNQLLALYRDLGLTPESFAERFDTYLGIPLTLDPETDTTVQLNQAVRALTGEDAGQLISKLVEEKDAATEDQREGDSGMGYGD